MKDKQTDGINRVFQAIMGKEAPPAASTAPEAPAIPADAPEVPQEETPEEPAPEEGTTGGVEAPGGELPVTEGLTGDEEEEIPQDILEIVTQLGENPDAAARSLVKLLRSHGDGITESLIQEIPGLVAHLVEQRVEMAMTAIQFYKDNPELEKHKNIVQMVGARLEGENPGMEKGALLGKIAEESKLELAKIKSDGEDTPSLPPDDAPGGKVGNSPAPGNTQQDKMAKLLKRAGRA